MLAPDGLKPTLQPPIVLIKVKPLIFLLDLTVTWALSNFLIKIVMKLSNYPLKQG